MIRWTEEQIKSFAYDELNDAIAVALHGWELKESAEEKRKRYSWESGNKFWFDGDQATGYAEGEWDPGNITNLQYVIDEAQKQNLEFQIEVKGGISIFVFQGEILYQGEDFAGTICRGILLALLQKQNHKDMEGNIHETRSEG